MELFPARVREHGVVGASLAVVRDGEITLVTAGTLDGLRPVADDTRFQIASITKPMVAVAIAMLQEQGALAIDDAITDHVPELRGCDWATRISLRQLMAGTAGLPLTEQREFLFEAEGDDALAVFAMDIARDEPFWAPGTRWSYSNSAWCLLGRAIETAAGLEWETAMRALVTDPLGMSATTFRSFDPQTHAPGFQVSEGNAVPVELPPWTARALGPAGASIWSTASDLARFAQLLMEDRFAHLRDAQADVSIPHFADGWCLGLARFDWQGGPVWGWDGVGSGHRAILRVVPSKASAYVLLTNSSTGRLLYRQLFSELLEPLGVIVPPIDTTPADVGDLARYEGTYAWPDRSFRVAVVDGGLRLFDGDTVRALAPVDERLFLLEGAPAEAPMVTLDGDVMYQLVWAYPRVV